MKSTIACWAIVIFIASLVTAEEDKAIVGQVAESNEAEFLPKDLDPGLAWLRFYGTFPESQESVILEDAEKQALAQSMLSGETVLLNSEVLPAEKFIAGHMKACAAGSFVAPNDTEDVVFLRYAIGARDFLLARTAGTRCGRTLLFMKNHAGGKDSAPVKRDEILRPGVEQAGVSFIEYVGGACVVVHWPTYGKAKGLGVPQTEEQENEWFSRVKNRVKDDEKIEQHRTWRRAAGESEVKALIDRLPNTHPDKKDFEKRLSELSSALKATPADDPKHEGIVSHWAMLVEEIEISVAQLERKPLPEGIRKGDIQKWSEENSRK